MNEMVVSCDRCRCRSLQRRADGRASGRRALLSPRRPPAHPRRLEVGRGEISWTRNGVKLVPRVGYHAATKDYNGFIRRQAKRQMQG